MNHLSNVLDLSEFKRECPGITHAEAIRDLAQAHGIDELGMTRIWRAAGLEPPTDRGRLDKYCAAARLLPVLRETAERRRAEVLERTSFGAFAVTHLRKVAADKPTIEQALGWIRSDRLRTFAERFDPDTNGGALLLGPTGLGKSIAAFCLMLRTQCQLAVADYEATFEIRFGVRLPRSRAGSWASFDAMHLGLAMQRTGLGEPEPDEIDRAKRSEYLILDDLGWEKHFHVDTVLDVAAHRYEYGLPTIVTSGRTHEELRQSYGDAVLRRFWNVGGKDGAVIDLWGAK